MEQIFVYQVEDARADCWTSELAVKAASAGAALRILRQEGVRKSQFKKDGRPDYTLSLEEFNLAMLGPQGIARRTMEDSGWSAWTPVTDECPLNWRGTVTVGGGIGGAFRRPKSTGSGP